MDPSQPNRPPPLTALLLIGIALGGCGTAPAPDGPQAHGSGLAYPAGLTGDAGGQAAAPLLATRARLFANGRLQIEYLAAGQAAALTARLPPAEPRADPDAAAAGGPTRPPVVAFVPTAATAAIADSEAVAIRSPQAWQALIHQLQKEIAAQVPDRGVVLDVLRQHEILLYVDPQGELQASPMATQPAAVEPAGVVTLTELLSNASERVRATLRQEGEQARYLLFNTADTPDTGFPFVLMDVQDGRVFFVQQQVDGGRPVVHAPALAAHAAYHAITGQVKSLAAQPVTSFARLLTSLGTTAVDALWLPPLLEPASAPLPAPGTAPAMDADTWEQALDVLAGDSASHGQIDYLVDGVAFFPALSHAIGQARQAIRMRMYIFDNDDYAVKVADLLKARSRDVAVQILVDGLGTFGGGMAQAAYTPPHAPPRPSSMVSYLQAESDVAVRVVPNPFMQGDHTKVIIIDQQTAFLGGMNIGREYRYEWHDLMVRLSGPVVDRLIRDFENAWAQEGFFGDLQAAIQRARHPVRLPGRDDHPLRLLYTRPGDSQILRAQIAAMRHAQNRVWLQNPYLTSDAMLHELVAARRRGVDVRVILPYRNDAGLIGRSNVLAANELLRNGIRVFVYPGMSHLKAAVYDGWACLGSANLDKLSLRLNKETNIATSHAPAVQRLVDQVFLPDFSRAVELDEPLPASWLDHLKELIADHL